MRLENKLAIITAAASGMGKAGVELFVREGARVAAIDINREALDALAAEHGDKVIPLVADLSDADNVKAVVAKAAEALGGVDIMWAHAGIPGPSEVEGVDLAAYQRAIDLNITSALVCAGEVAPHMRQRGGGSLIFTASIAGLVGSLFSPVYSAAKFGVVGLAKSLSLRFAPDLIRVNAICPGITDTPMMPQFLSRNDDPQERAANEAKLFAGIPLGRPGQPVEIAQGALWLASDEASYVTGIALPIDGGFTAR